MANHDVKITFTVNGDDVVSYARVSDAELKKLGLTVEELTEIFQQSASIEQGLREGQIRSIAQVDNALRQLKQAYALAASDEDRARIAAMADQMDVLRSTMLKTGTAGQGAMNQAFQATQSINYILQDSAQFSMGFDQGIRAISNNVPMLVEQFARLRTEVGSGRKALTTMLAGLMGPGGVLAAVSLLSTAFVIFGDDIAAAFGEGTDELQEFKDELDEATLRIERMTGAMIRAKEVELESQLFTLNEQIREDESNGAADLARRQTQSQADTFAAARSANPFAAGMTAVQGLSMSELEELEEYNLNLEKRAALEAKIGDYQAEGATRLGYQLSVLQEEVALARDKGEVTEDVLAKEERIAALQEQIRGSQRGSSRERRDSVLKLAEDRVAAEGRVADEERRQAELTERQRLNGIAGEERRRLESIESAYNVALNRADDEAEAREAKAVASFEKEQARIAASKTTESDKAAAVAELRRAHEEELHAIALRLGNDRFEAEIERSEQLASVRRDLLKSVFEDMVPEDLDLGESLDLSGIRELFVVDDDLLDLGSAFEQEGGMLEAAQRIREEIRAAREEIDRLNESGEDTSGLEALVDQLEQTAVMAETLGAIGQEVFQGILTQTVASAAEAIGASLAGVENEFATFGDNMKLILASIAKQLGQMLIAQGTATILVNPAMGAGLLAAGFALTAIGSAAEARISQDIQERREAAQERPRAFRTGGLVRGSEQVIRVNEVGEEFVVNAQATRRHRELLERMNSGQLLPALATALPVPQLAAMGAEVASGGSTAAYGGGDMARELREIKDLLRTRETVLVAEDVTQVQAYRDRVRRRVGVI